MFVSAYLFEDEMNVCVPLFDDYMFEGVYLF